jgi:hypothetical protein
VIRYSTCRTCGNLLWIEAESQDVHRFCNPQPPPAAPSMLTAALWYASIGWPVFPLLTEGEIVPSTGEPSTGKQPATTHGFKDATTDLAAVTQWWATAPNRNIGLPTGVRFDVIDIDVPEGLPTLERLSAERDRAVHGWVDTPSGGVHLYITPTGAPNRGKRRFWPGVDFRGAGGYVVAPPSMTSTGTWRWRDRPSPLVVGTDGVEPLFTKFAAQVEWITRNEPTADQLTKFDALRHQLGHFEDQGLMSAQSQ